MAQFTFATKPAPQEPGQLNNFGNLSVDASHNPLAGVTGSGIQTVDISATPVVSPATVSNTVTTTLSIPLNAAQVTLLAATNGVNVSESDPNVATSYAAIPVGIPVTLDCTRLAKLFLKGNTAASTLSFWFTII
jgi:hypothetical protein